MTQPEGRLSRQIIKELNSQPNTFAFKIHGSEYMMSGVPDIIACIYGYFVALEVKRPETRSRLSKRQERVMLQIKWAGGRSRVVDSVEEALEVWADVAREAGAY